MDYTAIGNRVRTMRLSNRFTQEEMAKHIGISVSFIGHIERGARIASVETYVKIAKFLGVSIAYILEGDEKDSQIKLLLDSIMDIFKQKENGIY